jgi:outer membrane lipoprotein-sorting protein
MRRFLTVITILLIAAFAVSMFTGCSKGQKGVSGSTGVGGALSGDPIAQIFAKQKAMSSYVQIMSINGRSVRNEVKLKEGKPVRTKIDMGARGMVLVQYDKKVQYIVDPKTKVAMAMPVALTTAGGGASGGQSSMESMSDAAKMKNMKAVPETVDGVDCWKVTRTDTDLVFWSEKKNGLPVQVQVKAKEGVQFIKLKYEQLNSVPDSEFELPAGVKIQEMPKGMQTTGGH